MPEIETITAPAPAALPSSEPRAWHALWTRSHCERLVHDQLAAKGFKPFAPTLTVWSIRGGKQHQIQVPMFPGYIFLPGGIGKLDYIEVKKARGLVQLLGPSWDRLAEIPHRQIASIQLLQAPELNAAPHPYLRAGNRVRVVRGPLTGVEGFLTAVDPAKGRLVVSLELLQRSVSAEIDCSAVTEA